MGIKLFFFTKRKALKIVKADRTRGDHPLFYSIIMDCIFCKIVKGQAPSHKIWEDEKHLAFLSTFPNTKGFTVVITKNHYPADFYTLPENIFRLTIINEPMILNFPRLRIKLEKNDTLPAKLGFSWHTNPEPCTSH